MLGVWRNMATLMQQQPDCWAGNCCQLEGLYGLAAAAWWLWTLSGSQVTTPSMGMGRGVFPESFRQLHML